VEEEVMLLDAETLALAPAIEEVLDALPQHLRERATSETHASVAEMATRQWTGR
jgi:ABC-type polar amino acid transport system ATPase subunit